MELLQVCQQPILLNLPRRLLKETSCLEGLESRDGVCRRRWKPPRTDIKEEAARCSVPGTYEGKDGGRVGRQTGHKAEGGGREEDEDEGK